MAKSTDKTSVAAGFAALSICESLLLALSELKIIDADDARGILEDAAATHRGAPRPGEDSAVHQAAAALIEDMLHDRKSLPRS